MPCNFLPSVCMTVQQPQARHWDESRDHHTGHLMRYHRWLSICVHETQQVTCKHTSSSSTMCHLHWAVFHFYKLIQTQLVSWSAVCILAPQCYPSGFADCQVNLVHVTSCTVGAMVVLQSNGKFALWRKEGISIPIASCCGRWKLQTKGTLHDALKAQNTTLEYVSMMRQVMADARRPEQ